MNSPQLTRLVLVISAAGILAGCATTGYQRAERAKTSMHSTRQQALGAKFQVTRTMNALQGVVGATESDLRPGYRKLVIELKFLEKAAARARWRAKAMRKHSASYFNGWAKEIESMLSEGIRTQSAQRRTQSIVSYRQIERAMQEVEAAYTPLLADMRDIQSHLKQDLTASGIAAVRGNAATARKDAAALQGRINALVAEIDRVASELMPRPGPQVTSQ